MFWLSPIGIAIERAGSLRLVIRALLETLGFDSPEALIGRTQSEWIEFLGPPREDGAREAAGIRADGSRVEVSVTETMFPQVDGVGVVHFVVDLSERRVLERELKRTRRLEAVGLLAKGIAHDFNDLLTVIAGYVDLPRESTPRDSSPEGPLLQISAATDKASALTRQLLTFGGSASSIADALDLSTKPKELAPILRRLVGERIELAFDLAADLPPTKVDPAQVDQLLLDLVNNARDEMRGDGTVTIRTRRFVVEPGAAALPGSWPRGEYALLEVHDTGPGKDDATNYHVKSVAFASEALESLAQRGGRCDLLITDVRMPRMSGAELARCVRRHWPMVRCLFLAGYSEPELLAIQRDIEPEELLGKPFTTAQFIDRVRSALA